MASGDVFLSGCHCRDNLPAKTAVVAGWETAMQQQLPVPRQLQVMPYVVLATKYPSTMQAVSSVGVLRAYFRNACLISCSEAVRRTPSTCCAASQLLLLTGRTRYAGFLDYLVRVLLRHMSGCRGQQYQQADGSEGSARHPAPYPLVQAT